MLQIISSGHSYPPPGRHTVGSLSVDGELVVTGTLNGLSVPRDVYLRSRNETVSQHVAFHSVHATSVQVMDRLDGVRVSIGGAWKCLALQCLKASKKKCFK